MIDIISPNHRSWNMSRIRSKNTSPEKRVRSFLHRDGFRFRIHVKNLPGSPDIVMPKYRIAIFIHGCFWHRHLGCKYAYIPKSRKEFWEDKFKKNIIRDQRNSKLLNELGWKVEIIWECQVKNKDILREHIRTIIK